MFRWLTRLLFDREPRVGEAVRPTPNDVDRRGSPSPGSWGGANHGGPSVDGNSDGSCDGGSSGGPGGDGGDGGGGGGGDGGGS